MVILKRSYKNPILSPNKDVEWEAEATFNGCSEYTKKKVHLLYRAMSKPKLHEGVNMSVSTIGLAISDNIINFKERKQFIKPEYDWEKYGCEDPRVTKINGKFYIFYTALSAYPFGPDGIKVGLAITKDFDKITSKHLVTPFNAKAMSLFPTTVNGKMTAILAANTDKPPVKIAIARFKSEKDIWSKDFWDKWYAEIDSHTLNLKRSHRDHVEVGAPPVWTKKGWLLVYSYIKDYFAGSPLFTIEAVLLDLKDPTKIIGRTKEPLLVPETFYEKEGKVKNIVFPTGAFTEDDKLHVCYGAADTVCCLATCELSKLLEEMVKPPLVNLKIQRYKKNPILEKNEKNPWEAKAVFNPASIYLDGRIHIIYRAMSHDNISTLGYASTKDGFTIKERLNDPVYVPREKFESKGCEDPRLTVMGDTVYMCYTAFDGINNPRVALTSISTKDFLNKKWNWARPTVISPSGCDDKDAAIFPAKIKGKLVLLHRVGDSIDIDSCNNLEFRGKRCLLGNVLMNKREGMWDSEKVGIAAPPIKTNKGWLLLYHGVSKEDRKYRVGAALLSLSNPMKIIERTEDPLLEPEMPYEINGQISNVVFPCGASLVKNTLFIYYGGADQVICAASADVSHLFKNGKNNKKGFLGVFF